jgi:hypothetical protein
MSETPRSPAPDPRPESPREPEPGECCQSGYDPCVFDRYWDAVECYERALCEWNLRHSGGTDRKR